MIQRTPYADALTYILMVAGFLLLVGVVFTLATQHLDRLER